jgi:hypothetical protein
VLKEDVFYAMRYTAPARHYFDTDLRTFDSLVASFRLEK